MTTLVECVDCDVTTALALWTGCTVITLVKCEDCGNVKIAGCADCGGGVEQKLVVLHCDYSCGVCVDCKV